MNLKAPVTTNQVLGQTKQDWQAISEWALAQSVAAKG
jgi:hypothetical protein